MLVNVAVFWVIRRKERVCAEKKVMAVKTVKLIVITVPHVILMLYKPRCQCSLFPHLCDVKTCLKSHVFEQCWLMDPVAEVLQVFGKSVKCTTQYVKVK